MAEISTRLAFISAERQLEDTMRKHCDLYVILRVIVEDTKRYTTSYTQSKYYAPVGGCDADGL
jgi:hypothetical protein